MWLRWDHTGLGWALFQWLVSLKEEGNVDRDTGRMPCDDRGRDCSDASTSQGMPVDCWRPHEARGGIGWLLSGSLQRSQASWHLDFWLLAFWTVSECLLFKATQRVVLCHRFLWFFLYIYNVILPSPPSNFRAFPSTYKETLYLPAITPFRNTESTYFLVFSLTLLSLSF